MTDEDWDLIARWASYGAVAALAVVCLGVIIAASWR